MAGAGAPESIQLTYKRDDFEDDISARVTWSSEARDRPRPIALIYHPDGFIAGSSDISYHTIGSSLKSPSAFVRTIGTLPGLFAQPHQLDLDIGNVVALGHSSGGTMVLHLAALKKPLRAITAMYPFLFVADESTNAHRPATGEMFDTMPDQVITDEYGKAIKPAGEQLSEAPMPVGGVRNKRLTSILRNGSWPRTLQPNEDFAAIDPFTRIYADFVPTYLIHGSEDNVPGWSEELVIRAGKGMTAASARDVHVHIVRGAQHLLDHLPRMNEKDWQALVKGLDWLIVHARRFEDRKLSSF